MQNDLTWTYYNSYFVTASECVSHLSVSDFQDRSSYVFQNQASSFINKILRICTLCHGHSFQLSCLGNSFIQHFTNLLASEHASWALRPQSSLKSLVEGCKFKISKHDLVVKFARLTKAYVTHRSFLKENDF